MNIDELAKTMTKEEFLNNSYVQDYCPGKDGLKEFEADECNGGNISMCRRCWEMATEDIKFKDEIKEPSETSSYINFLCIKDFYMDNGEKSFTVGKIYIGATLRMYTKEEDSHRITFIDDNRSSHIMSKKNIDLYFVKANESFDTATAF